MPDENAAFVKADPELHARHAVVCVVHDLEVHGVRVIVVDDMLEQAFTYLCASKLATKADR